MIGALCALCLSVAAAQATTITFEGQVSPGGLLTPATPYTEGGFILTDSNAPGPDGIFGPAIVGVNTNGTSVFGWDANFPPTDPIIDLKAVGEATFSLSSLDAALLDDLSGSQLIMVVGSFVGGGTVTQLLSLTSTWTTFYLIGFTNLAHVDFSAVYLGDNANNTVPDPAIDNINLNVSAVPVPAVGAGVPAIVAAVALLFGYRRRRRAVAA